MPDTPRAHALWRRLRLPVTFTAGLALGAGVMAPGARADADERYGHLRVLAQALTLLEDTYVDALDPTTLAHDAIIGMFNTLDTHSQFLSPAAYQKIMDDTAGEFGGLGIELSVMPVADAAPGQDAKPMPDAQGHRGPEGAHAAKTDASGTTDGQPGDDARVTRFVISRVFRGTPAARAGLKAGDELRRIDDTAVAALDLEAVIKALRGPAGSRVHVHIARPGWSAPHKIALIRRRVRVQSVDYHLHAGGIGYVAIRSFQDRTALEVTDAVELLRGEARARGQAFRGLVLDMRDNPGGLFDEGVKVADYFLKRGVIVTTKGRSLPADEVETASDDGTEPTVPLVVLVDGGTASASEVVAGALQDHGRAVLLGTQSYGKGSVQTLVSLADGSGAKVTIARYYTPSGASIHGVGLEPDATMDDVAVHAPDLLARPMPVRHTGEDRLLAGAVALVEGLIQGTVKPPPVRPARDARAAAAGH